MLVQEHDGQDHRDHDAQLIDGGDLGSLAKLQRPEVAQPRGAGRQAGQDQEQPRL
jgi:hypothetical protein